MVDLPNLAATVDVNGISAPPYTVILATLQDAFRSIFGADVAIDPDTQDGQLIAIFSKALSNANDAAIATYNAYAPSTATGAALSSNVKINGISRKIPTNSAAIVRLRGQAGTQIVGGVVRDSIYQLQWVLPASVIIPYSGEIDVTALCATAGAFTVGIGQINQIVTPVPGWQTVSNEVAPSTPGAPVETDAELRRRQAMSVAIAARSVLDGIVGAVWSLQGVHRVKGYENPTNAVQPGTGLPPHSLALVAQGGDVGQICSTIALTKTPGSATTGDVVQTILDPYGIPNIIRYWQLILVPLTVQITVTPLAGFVSSTSTLIRQAVVEFVNRVDIGETSFHNRLFAPANLSGDAATDATGISQAQLDMLSDTFNIAKIEQGMMEPTMGFVSESSFIDGFEIGSWAPRLIMGEQDLPIHFREAFTTDAAHVSVVIA